MRVARSINVGAAIAVKFTGKEVGAELWFAQIGAYVITPDYVMNRRTEVLPLSLFFLADSAVR
jgi:hypothetical protein